jgi:hypothetical protein
VARVLQRPQVRVRGAPGLRRGRVAGAGRGGAGVRGRRRAPGRRRRRRRLRRGGGRPDVHAGEVRARGGVQGLGSVLHDEPRRQRRPGAQHLPPASLTGGEPCACTWTSLLLAMQLHSVFVCRHVVYVRMRVHSMCMSDRAPV